MENGGPTLGETGTGAVPQEEKRKAPVTRAKHPAPGTQSVPRSSASTSAGSYTGDQIQILEGVQHIRQRPGMYIGTTSTSGLLHLVYEAIDNVVDEFNAGFGSQMWITIDADGRVTVRDEARGIPIDPKEWGGTVLPTATWIFIKPFTGGKFEPGAYKQAGGLHGVGLTVINALSAEMEVDIWRDGQHFHQLFQEGEALDYSVRAVRPVAPRHPDPLAARSEHLRRRRQPTTSRPCSPAWRPLPASTGACWIELTYWDEETGQAGPPGPALPERSGRLREATGVVGAPRRSSSSRSPSSRRKDEVSVEVVLQPDSGYKTQILSFANGVRTPDGGTHETGFKAALTKVVNDYALKWGVIKDRSEGVPEAGRHPAGPRRHHLGEAGGPPVPGPDQEPAEQRAGRGDRRARW